MIMRAGRPPGPEIPDRNIPIRIFEFPDRNAVTVDVRESGAAAAALISNTFNFKFKLLPVRLP